MGHAAFRTGSGHRFYFISPASFIEIGGKKVAGVICEQWIQTNNLLSSQVAIDDLIA